MVENDAKAILIENVLTLMELRYGRQNITAFGRDTGISTGGTQRVLDPVASVGVDILSRIAAHFKLEVWQLLAPNLGQALILSPAEAKKVREMRDPEQAKPAKVRAPAKQRAAGA
jgi:hypothetical protein